MIKRLLSLTLCALMALGLCGCAGLFEKEYVFVEDYAPAPQPDDAEGEKLTVHDFSGLLQAMRDMVGSGQSGGTIVFDSAYDGDVAEDLSDACWQLRTQDALCAYCVVNIFYELNKIVAYHEAEINISYSDYGEKVENIARLPYSTGVDSLVRSAIASGRARLALLINHSSLSAEDMEDLVAETYRENPAIAPQQPHVSVNMYSGTNQQRLYELNLRYGMTAGEFEQRKLRLSAVRPFDSASPLTMSEGRRALAAFDWLRAGVTVSPAGQNNSIYSALVEGAADSEGIALAYVELCRQLGLDCRVVYGQRNWQDHCWNILRVGQDYYHVDAALGADVPGEECFMRRDEHIWEICRWDMASYPSCTGTLSYSDVLSGRDTLPHEMEKPKLDIASSADAPRFSQPAPQVFSDEQTHRAEVFRESDKKGRAARAGAEASPSPAPEKAAGDSAEPLPSSDPAEAPPQS